MLVNWKRDNPIEITAEIVPDTVKREQPRLETETVKIELPEPENSPLDMEFEEAAVDDEALAFEELPDLVTQPAPENLPSPVVEEVPIADLPTATLPKGGGLSGRDGNARGELASKRGGNEASESAVESGLKWIAAHQLENGSWRLNHQHGGQCKGQCGNPGSKESTTAATGLALMSFLGAGYTHQNGQYQKQVADGLDYLVGKMRHTKFGGSLEEGSMYAHGIATIALAEAYAMTGDTSLHEPVAAAVKFIESAQHSAGGWRYSPGEPGDMTVTGWQIMALKSAQLRDINASPETWEKASGFVDSLGSSGLGMYGYQQPDENPTMTAIGLLSQMYMGWPREKEALSDGMDLLIKTGPSKHDLYFNYYGTLVLHHTSAKEWPAWNSQLRDYLVQTQSRQGHQAGSWFFKDKHGSAGGRLYSTAMAVMILEVYYRYMPLYSKKASE